MKLVRVHVTPLRRQGDPLEVMVDEHVSAMSGESRWLPVADVIVCRAASPSRPDGPHPVPETAMAETFSRYPGCLIVAEKRTDGTCAVGTREGEMEHIHQEGHAWVTASAAHALIVSGRRLTDLRAAIVNHRTAYTRPVIDRAPLLGRLTRPLDDQGSARPDAAGPVLLAVRRLQ